MEEPDENFVFKVKISDIKREERRKLVKESKKLLDNHFDLDGFREGWGK